MSHIIQVSIGRNVSESNAWITAGTMPDFEWSTFQLQVKTSLSSFAVKRQLEAEAEGFEAAYFITTHTGTGEWDGEPEESALLTIVSQHKFTGIETLTYPLSLIAEKFGQQAISITTGESDLYFTNN